MGTDEHGFWSEITARNLAMLWRKTDGQFHRGIFGMNFSFARSDDQARFCPCFTSKPFWQIFLALQTEQAYERRIAFAENDRPFANNNQSGLVRAGFYSCQLRRLVWKHARKKSAESEMICRRRTIIGHRAAQFKPAGQLLRVLAFHAGTQGKIRRTAGDEIEFLVRMNNSRRAEIALTERRKQVAETTSSNATAGSRRSRSA